MAAALGEMAAPTPKAGTSMAVSPAVTSEERSLMAKSSHFANNQSVFVSYDAAVRKGKKADNPIRLESFGKEPSDRLAHMPDSGHEGPLPAVTITRWNLPV